MRKEYQEMFDEIHAPKRLRMAIMNMKTADNPSMPPKRRTPTAALIGAVLVVVLAGTAFAAVIGQLSIRVVPDGKDAGYTVTGGSMTKYPLSSFSAALLEASEGRGSLAVVENLRFDTWDEVAAFLGPDIPCVWPDGGEDWPGPYHVYLFHTGSDQLWGVEISSTFTSGFAEIDVYIRTENWTGDAAGFGRHDTDTEGYFSRQGSYPMANGLIAEIVQYAGSEEFPHAYCEGYFMREGIVYDVTTYGTISTQDDTLSRLCSILDAYE